VLADHLNCFPWKCVVLSVLASPLNVSLTISRRKKEIRYRAP